MSTLTLKNKIIILAVTLLLLIAGCVTATVYGLYVSNIATDKMKAVFGIQDKFQMLRFLFAKSLMGPHDYLIHGNKDEKKIFETDLEKLHLEKGKLKDLIESERTKAVLGPIRVWGEVEERLLTLEKKLSEYETIAGKILGLEEPTGHPKAGPYMEAMDLIVRQIEGDLEKAEMTFSGLADRTSEQRDVVRRHVMTISIILGIIAVLAGSMFSFYIIRSITRPIGHLVTTARKITGGDLTTRAEVATDDEIGELADSFNNMVEKLLFAKEHMLAIFQGSGDGIRVIDKDFNILQANTEMEKFTGVAGGESVGEKCYEQFSHEICHTEDCTLRRIMTGEERIDTEIVKRVRDGREIPVRIVATPLKKGDDIIGVIECIRDISERRKAEEALQKSHDELEQALIKLKEIQTQMLQSEKMASIGQLAAGVAHEINNPTGFISSNLNSLASYHKDISALIDQYRALVSKLKEFMATEEGRVPISENLNRIAGAEKEIDIDFILNDTPNLIKECEEGAERIKKIVIDLKDFAHPGEQKLEYADINKNMESTLNVVWNELKYKAKVIKEYGDLPQVKCYSQQLNQIFVNLLVNAAQAIEKQGEINITTRALDGKVEIKISDTGKGIPKENLSKIFDPFFTTKEVGKGTGLGLNVVYNIIEKHKGTIDVESEVGKGTTFTIRIPVNGD